MGHLVTLLVMLVKALRRRLAAAAELRRSESWPTAEGRVHSQHIDDENGPVAVVLYSYCAQGEYHSGTLRRGFFTQARAQRWLDGFPRDAQVLVRYCPERPSRSVLRPDDNAHRLPAFADARAGD